MKFENLLKLGANEFILNRLKEIDFNIYQPARVFSQHSGIYRISFSHERNSISFLSGKFKKSIKSKNDLPVAGDWVIVENKEIHNFPIIKIIERYSKIEREHPFKKHKQMLASNIDIVFIIISADKKNFTESNIKKYIELAIKNKIPYLLIINKIDLASNLDYLFSLIKNLRIEKEKIFLLNSINLEGYADFKKELVPFKTSVLIGHSGAGKSTIINNLYGSNIKKTSDINQKTMKGKQTTTQRELIILPNNHIIMDIPGLSFTQKDNLDMFKRIMDLSCKCKFSNCHHITEPECAIKKAVENGDIDVKLYQEYLKIFKK